MFFAIHAGRPKRQKVTESVRLGSKGANTTVLFLYLSDFLKRLFSFFSCSRTEPIKFQGGSLYPGFFFRKLPAVLPERIDIPGEKDEDYPNDENKDTSPFSPGEV